MLRSLEGRLPVPPVLATNEQRLTLGFIDGAHGQDLIEAGHADAVMRACGRTLRGIHGIDVRDVLPDQHGDVIVHGDYGPNNLLLDPDTTRVTAVVDWEWAHSGDPIEDLAWCEWIVRAHHPDHVAALAEFFDAYGRRPPWSDRQEAMVARHHVLIDFCQRWEPGGESVKTWKARLTMTEGWAE